MLIHGGFWKEKFGLELMLPSLKNLLLMVLQHGILNTKGGVKAMKGLADILSDVMKLGGNLFVASIDIVRSMIMGTLQEVIFHC